MLIYTRQTSGRRKPSQSKRFLQLKEEHKKFLESVGYTGKRKNVDRSYNIPNLKDEPRGAPLSNAIPAGGGYKRSIDDHKWRRGRTESDATIAEIERKKTRVAPAFNKGATMYVSDGMDPASLGRKI
jgi:hypothetical protein